MATTYNWVISSLECAPEVDGKNNVVQTIHWRRQATDGANTADIYGSQALAYDPASPFLLYDNLTPQEVEGWLVNAMGADKVAELDKSLDAQLETLAHPKVVTPALPWSHA